jgi:hypothetical protein
MLFDKVILGCSPFLELAAQEWQDAYPGIKLELRTVELDRGYRFSDELLSGHQPTSVTVFVAWSSDFLNFQRWELFGALKKLGCKLPGLAHPTSILPTGFKLNEGVWIRPYAMIGKGSEVGMNSVIGSSARLGPGCVIERSVWLDSDVEVGSHCRIGANSVLVHGTQVVDRSLVGRHSLIETKERIESDLPAGSFKLRSRRFSGRVFNLKA